MQRRLVTETIENAWMDNVEVFFVEDGHERVKVATATSGQISNQPYACDESFRFEAVLYESGDALIVKVHQRRSAETDTEEVWRYESRDGGRTWQLGPGQPDPGSSRIYSVDG